MNIFLEFLISILGIYVRKKTNNATAFPLKVFNKICFCSQKSPRVLLCWKKESKYTVCEIYVCWSLLVNMLFYLHLSNKKFSYSPRIPRVCNLSIHFLITLFEYTEHYEWWTHSTAIFSIFYASFSSSSSHCIRMFLNSKSSKSWSCCFQRIVLCNRNEECFDKKLYFVVFYILIKMIHSPYTSLEIDPSHIIRCCVFVIPS